jgi:F0F1-type ATP synthase epsilon subunit
MTHRARKRATSSVDDGATQVKKKKATVKSDEAPRKGNQQPARKKTQR